MKKGTAKYYREVCTSICLPQEELRDSGEKKTADEEEDEDDDDDGEAGECAAVAPVAFGMVLEFPASQDLFILFLFFSIGSLLSI
ncbi:hypothetical protein RUM43_009431 [Polyplax serrata]|uniref:Uncharacterized protein n=1 Tax=Polyplax serrata TaxID=468196 RepID=A0AAN8PWD6_POLSC